MAQIRTIDLNDARSRLRPNSSGSDARAPYREAIANLTAGRMLELEPDEGETMRGLKLNVTRAGQEINRQVKHGESDEGTLLVWLETPKKARRAYKRKTAAATEDRA